MAIVFAAVAMLVAGAPSLSSAFVTFETGQVRPLAMSPDGTKLFACNTPDNTLEIFDVTVSGLTHAATVPVGLEPLAVAARTNTEVWVVNHLSDSISIVDVTTIADARVVRTLLVGDEPRDIVFAASNRAYITTAHRGQNTPLHAAIETELTTEGIGRADVWVFDALSLGATLGGTPVTIIELFGDTPRALAVSPDGNTVYAAVFHSGNRTTSLSEGIIPNGCEVAGGLPEPCSDHLNVVQPEVGLIVRFNGSQWVDELGRDWSASVRFTLPDQDVFAIDATQNPPVQIAGPAGFYSGVGTILFNMAVNPVSGKVYVSNTEAFNEVRFEGPGTYANGFKPPGEPDTVQGHLAESRITVLDSGVTPIHLNKHIDYTSCCDALPNATNDKSLAFPLDMAITSDGSTLYVAAFGSSKIGVYDTNELETDTFTPNTADQFQVTGGGPTGLVLDETNGRLYVLTRFDNSVSVLGTNNGLESQHISLHNPEPASVVDGRRFLYDARFTSAHGDSACASCHIFGDFDSLAWDLGNPDDTTLNNPGPIIPPFNNEGFFGTPDFRAMKGPMTTQSLRGMDNHGPMHWRGDRTGGNDQINQQPNLGAFNEDAGFKKFNPAFVGLIGRSAELTEEEMDAFTDFILQVMYPPNPIRNLDDSMTAAQLAGRNHFFSDQPSDTVFNCDGCHVTNPNGNASQVRKGFFGSDGRYTFENETQFFKVAHLRNLYQKVGMFGMPAVPFFNPGNNANLGDQVRGFGFLHDGSVDTVFRFHNATVFNQSGGNPDGFPAGVPGDPQRRDTEAFMHAFPSNHHPIVGQQITRTSTNAVTVNPRINLLLNRFDNPDNPDDPDDLNAPECDVTAKGVIAGEQRGYVYVGGGNWESDREADGTITDAALRALADTPGQELTFTATPAGEGVRIGVDRDEDGFRDSDELDGGSDPTDPLSFPCDSSTAFGTKDKAGIKDVKGQLNLKGAIVLGTYDRETVVITVEDGGGVIFDSGLLGDVFEQSTNLTTYKFKSKTGPITKAQIKVDPKVVGGFKVKVKTKAAWAPGLANETEATTFVTLNIGGVCLSGNATKVD